MKKLFLDKKYRGLNSNSFTGRIEGGQARKELQLDQKDFDSETYEIVLPVSTTSFNASFFLGLFYPSIQNLGTIAEFEKKYSFSYDDLEEGLRPFIAKDIKESLRKAENELQGSTGIDLK